MNKSISRIRCRLHQQGPERVLAAADEDALGKKHAGGGRVLDLAKFAAFYGEETVDEEELEARFAECSSANLVGERAVGVALKMGLAAESQVVRIGEVPHLQLYRPAP
ncbi:Uncharacterised protein [uncultured archaeon]|nr:Uncharacterised protein [uncultured archaeon]